MRIINYYYLFYRGALLQEQQNMVDVTMFIMGISNLRVLDIMI